MQPRPRAPHRTEAALRILIATLAAGAPSCKVQLPSGSFTCEDDRGCPDGWSCDHGLCFSSEEGSSPSTDRDSAPAPAADGGETALDAAAMLDADAGEGSGRTDAGAALACSDGQKRPCYEGSESSRGHGRCADGEQHCEQGEYGACVGSQGPVPETCNGLDDDCDGNTDENTDVGCYPDGATGCVRVSSVWQCTGGCRLGIRTCRNSKLSECESAVVPEAERCTESGAAQDENCDGSTDEGCNCHLGDQLLCYPGPAATLGVGACHAGTLGCVDGKSGDCQDAVQPAPESCANEGADDDCNHVMDDIPGRNDSCTVSSAFGSCASGTLRCQADALLCVTPMAQAEACNGIDDDCNGTIDDGFDLNNDPNNCGSCGAVCATGDECCSGQCTAPTPCSDGTVRYCTACPPCVKICNGRKVPCNFECVVCPVKLPNCNLE